MKHSIAVVLVVFVIALAACGGGGSSPAAPSIPTPPPVPQVAGNYFGAVRLTFPELGVAENCTAQTTVLQAGTLINVGALVGGGACAGDTIPALGEMQMSSAGAFTFNGVLRDSDCPSGYNVNVTGSFVGRDLQLSMNAVSSTCWNWTVNGTLSR